MALNAKDIEKNPTLTKAVDPDNDLKNMLVEYVGDKLSPDDELVTVEMIVEVLSTEFPEFMLAMAEENWLRGYQQALIDADSAVRSHQKELEDNSTQEK